MALPLLVALALEGLAIRTNTPLALCPTVEAVEQAVAERLRVEDGQRWELVLENAHRAEPAAADYLHVQLFDGGGEVRTDQELDVSGADCSVRAQAVAVLVADQFEAMRLKGPVAHGVDDERPPPVEPASDEMPGEPAKTAPRLALGLGAAVDAAWSPTASLRASVHASRFLELSALMLAPIRTADDLMPRGHVEAWAFPLRLSAALAYRGRRADVWFGPELLAEYERATTTGILENRTNRRAVWGVGGQLGVRVHGSGPWGAYLVLASDYAPRVPSSRFVIDGDRVLQPSRLQGGAALGVDYDFF